MLGFSSLGEHALAELPADAGATAYTLTADVGAFALSGQSSNLLYGRRLPSDAAAFVLSGQNATLTYTTLGTAYSLTADAGAFALAGQAASLLSGRKVNGDAGAFSLTGQSASLLRSRLLPSDAGAFTLSGQAATLKFGRRLAADAGAFVLAGIDATLTKTALNSYTLSADTGAFYLTGQSASLIAPLKGIQIRTDLLVEPYSRRAFDGGNDNNALIAFLIEELRRVENTLRDVSASSNQVADREPTNKRRGMVRYAVDPWNPGSGDGLYVYDGTVWSLIR